MTRSTSSSGGNALPVPNRYAALLAFLRSQTAGGIALIIAAMVALIWSNDSGAATYFHLIAYPVGGLTVQGWINDGLMAVFFLTVGLEIRRELTEGELSSIRHAAAPGMAALGGMIVPALIYICFNQGDAGRLHGWAVPVATDIAFALAALSVLGRRVPVALKVFLTALAIIDDLGAIAVIALFYTADLNLNALAAAAMVATGLLILARVRVAATWVYLAGGAVLWGLMLRSGVHPTIAGVVLAFIVPMTPVGQRLEIRLGPWITWLVMPLFGLANAGVSLHAFTTSPAALGIALGLIVGKPVGVFSATWLSVRLGWARLPSGLTWPRLAGVSMLCGIGFTMSLFIGDLAFHGGAEVKLGVFAGSLTSAALGIAVLFLSGQDPDRSYASGKK